MAVTIKDIAKKAGVSHTTVSRALKNNPSISAETTAHIQHLAQQMGYVPNTVAQSLLSQRTRTIGMVVTTIADPFITEVVAGVERAAQAAGYSLFLSMSHDNPQQEVAVVETLHRRRVDAIIVTSSRVGLRHHAYLNQIQIPVVLINGQEEGQYLYSISVDDAQGAQLAVTHLLSLDHRRIGYIGVRRRPKSNRRRYAGYEAALQAANVVVDPTLILEIDPEEGFAQGGAALHHLQSGGATAVFCYNDMIAIGLLAACRAQKISVPQQLSIVGFDDIEPAAYVTPQLTTVHQPRADLGRLAMHMALDLLQEKAVQNQRLACELIVRASTTAI